MLVCHLQIYSSWNDHLQHLLQKVEQCAYFVDALQQGFGVMLDAVRKVTQSTAISAQSAQLSCSHTQAASAYNADPALPQD